jgi:hypothetical protein
MGPSGADISDWAGAGATMSIRQLAAGGLRAASFKGCVRRHARFNRQKPRGPRRPQTLHLPLGGVLVLGRASDGEERVGPRLARRARPHASCARLRVAPVPILQIAFHAVRLFPGLVEQHPRRKDAGMGPAEPRDVRDLIMAVKNNQKPAQQPTRTPQNRQVITLELVIAHAPNHTQAERMSSAYGLDPVDYHGVREATEEQTGLSAQVLHPTVNETAMRIHLQRIVGAFVSSAHGAAGFYQSKVTQARDLTSKLANEDRDEDRDGVYGFETKAARARQFAAQAGLTAYALLAAAEGAVHAYAEITGEEWKPYETPLAAPATVSRQSAATEMAAFA